MILGRCGLNDVVIDMNGEYETGCQGYAVMIEDYETALLYRKPLLSDGFKEVL